MPRPAPPRDAPVGLDAFDAAYFTDDVISLEALLSADAACSRLSQHFPLVARSGTQLPLPAAAPWLQAFKASHFSV